MLDSITQPVLELFGHDTPTRRRRKSTRARRTYVVAARPRRRKVSRGRKTSTRRTRRY